MLCASRRLCQRRLGNEHHSREVAAINSAPQKLTTCSTLQHPHVCGPLQSRDSIAEIKCGSGAQAGFPSPGVLKACASLQSMY
jgi:hypothetical protein